MRYQAKKSDKNQPRLIEFLRSLGCSVVSLHAVGGGVPDLLIGYEGKNYLIEVKNQNGRLNARQKKWHLEWKGQVVILKNEEEIAIFFNSYIKGKKFNLF
jgi:hypothetical protein